MINPALDTRWTIWKDGKEFHLTIKGIVSNGFRDNYRVISYSVKYDHLEPIQSVPAQKIYELINTRSLVFLAVE